ncbi:MAG TPA: glycosyltransferase family 39 protein, partial [Gaiellaceae bacterium]|nr:glycosyltransferase family 39 protein [Gaiellaceae bacterium]
VVAVVILALPVVWWSPLNVDEELTLRVAQFSFGHIFHVVSTERGGGPLHFWLEGGLQSVWPGLPSLRVPSLVFLCLALPAVALVARQLAGDEVAAAVVLLTAVSPIPVSYATFGRPHTLLFAWLMWGTVLVLRAARDGDRRLWIAGGAVLGLTVFVHPTAPLYAITTFGVALVYAPQPVRELVRTAWLGAVALVVTFLPYYATTLHVLGDRYGVGTGSGRSRRTFDGRPVWEDALHFVAPGAHDINYFTALAAAGVVVLAFARRWRVLLFCALTVAAPVVFFTVVPASGDSALFFDRYMIPVTPAFLVVLGVACAWIARWAGRFRLVVFGLLVAGLFAVEVHYDVARRNQVHSIALSTATHAVAHEAGGSVMFGSTGTAGAAWVSFDYGHPANLFSHYVSLRVPVRFVPDDSCARIAPFLASVAAPAHGIWLFYTDAPGDQQAAARAFAPIAGVTVERPTPRYFVVRSTDALSPRALVTLGLKLRSAWHGAVPLNTRVNELIAADRQALAGSCADYPAKEELGDPGTSPHWPPVEGPQ